MLQIAHVQREVVQYVTSCPCHRALSREDVEPTVPAAWARCPLRGCRCAELAAGDFFQLLQSLFDTNVTMLESMLPPGLEPARILQLKGFMVARQRLMTTYVVKLAFWSQPPHLLAGLARPNRFVRTRCLKECVESSSTHPAMVRLKNLEDECRSSIEARVFGKPAPIQRP